MPELDAEPKNLPWRKSSYSGNGGCIEVTSLGEGLMALRDSKNPHLGHFVYNAHEWRSFLLGVRDGEFDDLV